MKIKTLSSWRLKSELTGTKEEERCLITRQASDQQRKDSMQPDKWEKKRQKERLRLSEIMDSLPTLHRKFGNPYRIKSHSGMERENTYITEGVVKTTMWSNDHHKTTVIDT